MARRFLATAAATLALLAGGTADAQLDPMGEQKNRMTGARLDASQIRLGEDGSAIGVLSLQGDSNSYCGLLIDYGDGSSENVKIELGQNFPRVFRHRYSRPGAYEIRVRGEKVTTHYPCEGNASLRLEVMGSPRITGVQLDAERISIGANGRAVARFTVSGTVGAQCGMLVDFGDGTSERVQLGREQPGFPRELKHDYIREGQFQIEAYGQALGAHPACEGSAQARLAVVATARATAANRPTAAASQIDELIRRASEGRVAAMNELGLAYASGKGVKQSYPEAAKWYRQAAERNDPKGMFNLGYLLNQGFGAPQDYAEALRLYKAAAERGFAPAMSGLGRMYALGSGVPADLVQAYAWFSLATALAEDEETREAAAQNRNKLAQTLSKADLAKAQSLAKSLQRSSADR